MANKNLFKAPFLRGELRMPDSNLGDLGIEWRWWPRWWWRPVAVWKYDSAIKRGRMAGMLVYARENGAWVGILHGSYDQ